MSETTALRQFWNAPLSERIPRLIHGARRPMGGQALTARCELGGEMVRRARLSKLKTAQNINPERGLSLHRKASNFTTTNLVNGLTPEIAPTYTELSMQTRMSTVTITMGNRMNPGPGVAGVRAQA
jgi:hypothetical protein